jgi:formylglycine-generating enzyme required for sulfatase activity
MVIVLPLIFFALPPSAKKIRTIRVAGAAMEMVYIPAGEFLMGAKNGWEDERPVHRVRISKGFWLGRTEITQGFWNAVMKANPAAFRKGDDHPVERVSWQDCQLFISRLNARSGYDFRLPTEAEWEYAARAGKGGERPADLDAVAWFAGNSAGSTHAVGMKQPNAFGLCDMLGNVWEWCSDWYEKEYYSRSPRNDPRGAAPGTHRVDRGGAWAYGPDIVRPGRRDGSGPDYRTDMIGLRLAAGRLARR